jgi:phosphoenolpyruvate carboxykinase (GTP)
MLIPPEGYRREGWKIFTVGDDIAWMQPGADGRLYAINPEAGFFGVAPGTSDATNPNALAMLDRDAIFTNTGVTADNQPWWEGLPGVPATDWQGRDFDSSKGPAAHPNSRFTVSAKQCPTYSPESENPAGVPVSAIIFGGRRASLVPLVMEAEDWTHGVLMGASMASETTAAATGAVGVVRRDPMAMKPFCGYNFADYFGHWLSFDRAGARLPKIFHVNWFRKSADGKFLWPGFGENMRVLEWIIARCESRGEAVETPVGHLPLASGLRTEGLQMPAQDLEALLTIEADAWQNELEEVERFMLELGERTPAVLVEELRRRRALLSERKAA